MRHDWHARPRATKNDAGCSLGLLMRAITESRSDIEEINARLARMAERARVLDVVFHVALWMLMIVGVIFAAASMIGDVSNGMSLLDSAISMTPFAAAIALGCMLLAVVAAGFKDVAKAGSPFTISQANRLIILGVLFLVYAVFEAVISVSPYYATIGIASVNYVASPHLFLDIKYILASIFCFCLSYVFRYGALLQWLQDETL